MAIQFKQPRVSAPAKPARLTTLRRRIARASACPLNAVREWDTRRCPDCQGDTHSHPDCAVTGLPHLPPLYYALAPELLDGDMPLGMGASPLEALTDLLWNIRARRLLDDLAAI